MIPKGIQAIFDFIDYLDFRKQELIDKYLPLCKELEKLTEKRRKLKPRDNYRDKRQYDLIQEEIALKFDPLLSDVYQPITDKLKELEIWSGDQAGVSIKSNISSSSMVFRDCFEDADVVIVNEYKEKYLSFRTETNSNFLTLQLFFSELDEALKEFFDFFRDSNESDLDILEPKVIACTSLGDAMKHFQENPKENVRFTFPSIDSLTSLPYKKENTTANSVMSELHALVKSLKDVLPPPTMSKTKTSLDEAMDRVVYLKRVIESNDGYRLFDSQDNQNEAFFQYLFKFIYKSPEWDINAEPNNGRGPVDFTISKGATDKTVIEFKLAKNSNLRSNLEHQVEIYKEANNTNNAVIAILYFSDAEYEKTQRVLKELGLNEKKHIILIDGRKKISASKA